MHYQKLFPLFAFLALFLALVAVGNAGNSQAAPLAGDHFVRIPAASVNVAATLGLEPVWALDYGSFQYLELSQTDFDKLTANGILFAEVADAGTIRVPNHRFDPLKDGEPDIAPGLRAPANSLGLHLIQLAGPTDDGWLTQLEAQGWRVLQYYPHHTFLVWGDAEAAATLNQLDFVRWQGAFHPAYKINDDLTGQIGVVRNVDVMFYNDGKIQATLNAIRHAGGNILQYYPSQPDKAFYNAIVQLPALSTTEIARIPTVLWLGYASPQAILEDEMSSQILAGNYSGGVPFVGYQDWLNTTGFDGTGVTWAIIDTGVDYQHPDLGPSIVGGRSYPGACNPPGEPGSDCSSGGHGTHVAGIVGGTAAAGYTDTNGYLYGLGVAPGYSIFASNSLSAVAWPPSGGWQEHSKWAVLGGAIGGNNSWTSGEGEQHGYQATERTHDIMVRDGNFDTITVAEPFIEVFSAGNSGFAGLTSPKEGKNLIIIASSQNYRIGNIDTISSFSSRGPAVDGRWVPTVTAPGEEIASSRNDTGGSCSTAIPGTNNYYAFCSGTSMAAPHASGAITITTEWWRSFNSGATPSPAMAKALLVNGAVDMGTADIPNIHEGWGRINIDNILNNPLPTLYYDQETTFGSTGEQWVLSVGVADPNQPLKITLAWSDAPGAVGANPALVNNLNLTVQNGVNSYYGNRFSAGWSVTGGAADAINNLENVFIQDPESSVTITVDAVNVSGDGVPYNGDTTDQDFVLICRNCVLSADFTLAVDPLTQSICVAGNAYYDITVGSLLGYNDSVILSAPNLPETIYPSFGTNPVTPPGTSLLHVVPVVGTDAGSYPIDIVGVALTSTHTTTVNLNVFTQAPTTPLLTNPANGATGVPLVPTFAWAASNQGGIYTLLVATDAGFSNVVYSTLTTNTSSTPDAPLDPLTTYYWRVRSSNSCGNSSFSPTASFTTQDIPPILLVDDDDNGPDVRTYYTDALGALGLDYDIWDTQNSDNEPSATTLAQYQAVIWFTGDEFGGAAGPGSAGETALASYLDAGNCLFLNSQDYLYDRGLTTFAQTYLGVTSRVNDVSQTSVTGAGSVYGSVGTLPLTYPFTNYSDRVLPDATAETAFTGNQGSAALNKTAAYRTTFWTFPFEALPAANRATLLDLTMDWCAPMGPAELAQLSYEFAMNNGSSGSGTYTLYENSTFVDSAGGGGVWSFQQSPVRLYLSHQGVSCNAFSVGTFPGGGVVEGLRLCTDGSGVVGLWTSIFVAGTEDTFR